MRLDIVVVIVAVVAMGSALAIGQVVIQDHLKALEKKAVDRNQIAKPLCNEKGFYDGNFDLCEDLGVRP